MSIIDGVAYYKKWNLGNSTYYGLSCPNIRLSDWPTTAYYLEM